MVKKLLKGVREYNGDHDILIKSAEPTTSFTRELLNLTDLTAGKQACPHLKNMIKYIYNTIGKVRFLWQSI